MAVIATLAWPWAFVNTVLLPVKVTPAPLAGALKVTLALLIGLPEASSTVTTSGLANAVPTVAVWLVPDVVCSTVRVIFCVSNCD